MQMVREFRPTIIFLAKFIGIYLIGNFLYGLYVSSYRPAPDPVTKMVTAQSAFVLDMFGYETQTANHPTKPTTRIDLGDRHIISVYEGCNGLNVMIIFIAFVVSFGSWHKKMWWFIPTGILLIHLANLARLAFLFEVTVSYPGYLYFTHKYLFTAIIYAMVVALWIAWVIIIRPKNQANAN